MPWPALPTVLRLFPTPRALQQAQACKADPCSLSEGDMLFEELWDLFEKPAGMGLGKEAWRGSVIMRHLMSKPDILAAPAVFEDAYMALLELRCTGITAQAFKGVSGSHQLAELTDLLERYEAFLEHHALWDEADHQRQAIWSVIQGRLPPFLSKVERIEVICGTKLGGARLDFLSAWSSQGISVTVRIPWNAAAAWAWPEAWLSRLEARGHAGLKVHLDDRIGSGPLAALRAAQWTSQVVEAPVQMVKVGRGVEHAQQIALKLSDWLRQGIPPQQMGVVVFDRSLRSHVMASLEDAGLRPCSHHAPPWVRSAPAQLMLLALRLPEQHFPWGGLMDIWAAMGGVVETSQGPWSAQRVAWEWQRAGGPAFLGGSLRAMLKAHAQRQGQGGPSLESHFKDAEAVASALEEVMATLAAVPSHGDLGTYVGALQSILAGFQRAFKQGPCWSPSGGTWGGHGVDCLGHLLEKHHRQRGADFDQLDVFLNAAKQLAGHLPPQIWHKQGLIHWLERAWHQEPAQSWSPDAGGIPVMDPEESVGTRFSRLILAGVQASVQALGRSAPQVEKPLLTLGLRAEINRALGLRLVQPQFRQPALGSQATAPDTCPDTWLGLEALASAQDELWVSVEDAPVHETQAGETSTQDRSPRSHSWVAELLRSSGGEVQRPQPSHRMPAPASVSHLLRVWAACPALRSSYAHASYAHAHAGNAPMEDAHAEVTRVLQQHAGLRWKALQRRIALEEGRQAGPARFAPLDHAACVALGTKLENQVIPAALLDDLAECHFRYFAAHILALRPDGRSGWGAAPHVQSQVIQALLTAVYTSIQAQGGLKQARKDPSAALKQARHVLETQGPCVLNPTAVHPLLHEALLMQAWQAVEAQLRCDMEAPDALEPQAMAHGFGISEGGPEAPPYTVPEPGGRRHIRVRGRVDRVDVDATHLRAFRYRRTLRLLSYPSLQLAVYALVAFRDVHPQARVLQAAFQGLGTGASGQLRRSWRAPAGAQALEASPEALFQSLQTDLWAHMSRLLCGDVSADPHTPRACKACDFGPLCRYDAQRRV